MPSLSLPKTILRQRQARLWKKRHLHTSQPVEAPAKHPVFLANTNKQELNDFVHRLRDHRDYSEDEPIV